MMVAVAVAVAVGQTTAAMAATTVFAEYRRTLVHAFHVFHIYIFLFVRLTLNFKKKLPDF
jgi:hypothetical protein